MPCRREVPTDQARRCQDLVPAAHDDADARDFIVGESPGIAAEWHPRRNVDLLPSDALSGANRAVWWQCALGHEWRTEVGQRTYERTSCPRCHDVRSPKARALQTARDTLSWRV
jgi:hypothetical protein